MNDDFGYLGSLLETIRRNRPWTDEWLEPWSASLAVVSALMFRLLGDVRIAVFGVQVIAAAAAGAAAYALFRARRLPVVASIVAMGLLVTFPTVQWKTMEYTSLVLYIPALLWVIRLAEERQWSLFLVVWLIALASRQSAITWVAIPLWEVLRRGWLLPATRKDVVVPAAVALAGAGAFVALSLLMNKTQSQLMVTDRIWEHVQVSSTAHHLLYGIGIWVIFSGLGGFALGWSLPRRELSARHVGYGFLAIAAVYTLFQLLPPIFFEHYSFVGPQGVVYRNLVVLCGLLGWLLFRISIRPDFLLAGMASLLLVAVRQDVWDYYYLDVAVLALFSVRPPLVSPSFAVARSHIHAGVLASLCFATFHGHSTFQQKLRIDRDFAVCAVTEVALRSNALAVEEIGHAPFGFIGWHLHRYFLSHDGKRDPDIGGFMRYLRPQATEVRFSPMRIWPHSQSLRPIQGDDSSRVVGSGVFRVGWFWKQRCSVLRMSTPGTRNAALKLDPAAYVVRSFPLNRQEWRVIVAGANN